MKIKIRGLTAKMKSKVKEFGPWWNAQTQLRPGEEVLITTTKGVHDGGREPYGIWVRVGQDIEVDEEQLWLDLDIEKFGE